MKKHAALLLALLFALGIAAPSLAYTNNAALQQGESPYTVDIYLVEYTDGDQLSSWLSMPPSDRGYAKNEIVAAISSLTVPANHSVFGDYHQFMMLLSENVSFDVMENKPYFPVPLMPLICYELNSNMKASVPGWDDGFWSRNVILGGRVEYVLSPESTEAAAVRGWDLSRVDTTRAIPVSSTEKTYRFLVFGKVLDDDASISFSLGRFLKFISADFLNPSRNPADPWSDLAPHITLAVASPPVMGLTLDEELVVYAQSEPIGACTYFVFENSLGSLGFHVTGQLIASASTPGQLMFAMETGKWGKTERLYMYPDGAGTGSTEYRIHVEPSTQELVFIITKYPPAGKATDDQIKFGTAGYNSLLAFYTEWFVEHLGFSAYNEGNILETDAWEAIANAVIDITATVEIQPWTPYVSVPDNIVTDPPKTGGAPLYAAYGVALVACAAGAWVMLRKTRKGNA